MQNLGVFSRRRMVGRRPCEVGSPAVCGAGGFWGPWQGAGLPMKPRRNSGVRLAWRDTDRGAGASSKGHGSGFMSRNSGASPASDRPGGLQGLA